MTTKKQITITISGSTGAGKSTLAALIKRTLELQGCEVEHLGDEDERNLGIQPLESILEKISHFAYETKVTLTEIQTRKSK